MPKLIDLTGQKFGRLTVLERAENASNGRVQWKCKCDCGNIAIVQAQYLRSGDTKSCGCLGKHSKKLIDLTNQQFGYWTVLEQAPSKDDDTMWLCQCKCGTIRPVRGVNLRKGLSNSCGCKNKEELIQKTKERHIKNNLVGQRFGKLTVIERTEERTNHGSVIYLCKCDCGNEIKVRSSHLTEGQTQSCGCINSKGEEKISQILRENNISFEKQKTFNDCRNPKTDALLRFDFYINNQYLLEYDGEQHFKEKSFGHENLGERQYKDKIKNQYCIENNIPLIRIPYTKYNTLCLEDLLLNKTQFLIKEE